MKWDDKNIGTLTRLRAEGVSAGNIAAVLNTNRNAVIGKIHRLGLPQPAAKQPYKRGRHVVMPGRPKVTPSKQKSGPQIVRALAPSIQPVLPSMPNGSNIPTVQRCTLLQLTSGVCKWPFGEPASPDFFFCGGDAVDGKPYCAGHCRVAYRGYWN